MGKFIDQTGRRFGRLIVVERAPNRGKLTHWRCRCDCGKAHTVYSGYLKDGRTKSCGCLRSDLLSIHGHAKGKCSRTYRSWKKMRDRCTNVRHRHYSYYGGRGINVCERWLHSFANFLADMGERPLGTTLDRRENDGNYEPGNCRWATWSQQMRNRRSQASVRRDLSRMELRS